MKQLRRNELRDDEAARLANSQEGAAQDRQRGDSVITHDGSPNSRPWLIAVPTAVLILLGMTWSGFWYWSTDAAEATMTAWRAREAEAGRIYNCATTAFGGFPFRIEVNCAEPSVDDQRAALSVRAHHLTAVAQVWDPTLVIAEILPPLAVGPLGGAPAATVDWTLAQASLRGMPGAPQRLSIVVDDPRVAAAPAGGPLAAADHMELHGRFAAASAPGHPALDLAVSARHATAPALAAAMGTFGPLASAGTDLSVVAVLHGVSDVTLKPVEQQLRDIQAANGRLDIPAARLQQGDLIAAATGALGLTARGTLSGDVKLTVVNLARLIPLLGIDRMVAQAVPQDALNRYAPALDRLLPGLGGVLRSRDNAGGAAPGGDPGSSAGGAGADLSAVAGAAMLGGQPTEFEGQRAVTLTLHFDDGVAFLGPLKLGRVPPLY
jgi:hypothetical protein